MKRFVIIALLLLLATPAHAAKVITTCGGFGCALFGIGPTDFYNIYNVPSPIANGGAGQCIAIPEGSNVLDGAMNLFNSTFGLPALTIQRRLVGTDPGLTADEFETEIDTQWAHALAPNAQIIIYIGTGKNPSDLLQAAVNDNSCAVISMSWVINGEAGTEFNALAPLYSQAAAQNQTVVVAAGDQNNYINGYATNPNVTAVGGTEIAPAGGCCTYPSPSFLVPTHFTEAAFGSIGGASTIFSKPSWQRGTGVPADGARDIPDVSAEAEAVYFVGHDTGSSPPFAMFNSAGGTSAACPAWAGMATLLNQVAGRRIGNLNPTIYNAANLNLGFYDVTIGSCGADNTNVGFDLCTGWGTPNFTQLEQSVYQFLSPMRAGRPF